MSYEAQHNALRQRFIDEWRGTPVNRIAWTNVAFDDNKESNAPWIRFMIEDDTAEQISVGGNPDDADAGGDLIRHMGAIVVQVFTPLSQGGGEGLNLADQVVAIFRRWETPEAPGVPVIRFRMPSRVRQVRTQSGDLWHQTNVYCPFERDSLN